MDEVWCGLDLQLQAGDIDGGLIHPAAPAALHGHDDPLFWPAQAECAASLLAGDYTASCFGVADHMDLTAAAASAKASNKAADYSMDDTSGFFADDNDDDHRRSLMTMRQDEFEQQQPVYSSSSLSSKRSLSIDSGGSSSAFVPLNDATPALHANIFSPPLPPAPLQQQQQQDPSFAGDDEAIMLAMMAVLSSASPSSSESSSPPHGAAAVNHPRLSLHDGDSASHVTVRSSSLAAVVPERTTSAAARRRQQQQQQDSNNSSQVYHMMSERKRREKLNDSFHTLRSLLPPCSKKDKTTVLMNAASYLKTLEAQVSELEEKNTKLERYVPREDAAGGGGSTAAHRRAKVHISRAASDEQKVSLTVMVMVECDIVDLVLRVLERLRWMSGVSVLSVDADTYSPQALLKALANIKLHIVDGDRWDEAMFHEAMTKAVHDATSSSSSPASCAAAVALLVAAA